MIRVVLRKGDGLSRGRPWLNSVVRDFQRGLVEAGHALDADGQFGSGTERRLREFQSASGVASSGAADPDTWRALAPSLDAALGPRERAVAERLTGFRGDLDWVHQREGHLGRPYWPKGASGVTLDPGVDLGQINGYLLDHLYGGLLKAAEMRLLARCLGLKGEHARDALNRIDGLKAIRISRDPEALAIMPFSAEPYWNAVVSRFAPLKLKATPPSVQTALLSLAYNRGPFNRGLGVLEAGFAARDWRDVAKRIAAMQQSHRLAGIRSRRRIEGALVGAELDFLEA